MKKFSRREFFEFGLKAGLGTIAVTACGDIFALAKNVKHELPEITVNASNFIIELEELKEYEALNFIYNGKKSILLFNNGQITAFENICTHKKGPTKLTTNKLTCQWHGATFDPLSGQALTRPAPKGSKLTSIKIEEKDGKIYITS